MDLSTTADQSDVNSELDAGPEAGSSASTPAALTRASQQELSLERLQEWESVYDHNSVEHRLHTSQYRFQNDSSGVSQEVSPASSETSQALTMSVSVASRSTVVRNPVSSLQSLDYYPPSLASDIPTIRSSSPARTDRADSIIGNTFLEPREDELLVIPEIPGGGRIACCFSFLNCTESFDVENWHAWDTHCKTHFHNKLPETVYCPFPCDWTATRRDAEEAWNQRRAHIGGVHENETELDITRRPVRQLLEHLWRNRLISDAEHKDLKMYGCLKEGQHLRLAGSDCERRRRRRTYAPSRR